MENAIETPPLAPMRQEGAFAELMQIRGLDLPSATEARTELGPELLPTKLRLSETLEQIMGAIGIAISDLSELAGRGRQDFHFASRHLQAQLMADTHTSVVAADGTVAPVPEDAAMINMRRMTQPWPTRDNGHFLAHFNLSHLRQRVLDALRAEPTPDSVSAAMAARDGLDLEDAIARARACGTIVRTADAWLDHPQGRALSAKPVIKLTRIGDAPPTPVPCGARLLSGLRVLDATRILAGPIAARTLAEQGADVLMITAPDLPQVPQHVRNTSHGKRSAYLDLDQPHDRERLESLVAEADVFSDGYRPGSLARRGFGPARLAELRPGIVNLAVSCYGLDGPFSDRAGWEQVAQAASGIAVANGDDTPRLIPVPACDYLTGFLGALGILLALGRRAREGGSWHVEVSLCASAMMLLRQGILAQARPVVPLTDAELTAWRVTTPSDYGRLLHLTPALQMPGSPAFWERPTTMLGRHAPAWL